MLNLRGKAIASAASAVAAIKRPLSISACPSSSPPVRLQRTGAFAVITLCNPSKRNALSLDVLNHLSSAFQQASSRSPCALHARAPHLRHTSRSDARGIILAAEGPVFSAGHNFGEMAGTSREAAHHLFATCAALMQAIAAAPQPVVARVHALATAAGCQLVASCDLAVAARSAAFALPGGNGGLFCHTPLVAVARNMAPKRAMEMALTGDRISAQQAMEWGLVNRVVANEELERYGNPSVIFS
jgi:enoyl-CoA hydratase/carnithine racemase